jgi:hypothetical protein
MDQHQNAHHTPVGFAVSAQTFVAGVTGSLHAISLWSDGTNGNQSVTVEICSYTAGIDCAGPGAGNVKPALAAGVLASATVGVDHPDGQWNNFVLSPTPEIVAGTTYAIVVLGDAGWTGTATNAYGSGAAFGYEAGWGSLNGAPVFDLAFQTFVTSSRPGPNSTPATTSSVDTAPLGDSQNPMPIFFALTAGAILATIVAARRYGLFLGH